MTVAGALSTAVKALATGTQPQSFLDATWVRRLLSATPARWQRRAALSTLGWSPHYYFRGPQHRDLSRAAFARHEFERNMAARRVIGDRLLRPCLRPSDSVLDYGCGPGFLTAYVSEHVQSAVGIDISRGALACARILNPAANVTFLHTSDVARIPAGSIDLACSFAVFQHMTDSAVADALTTMHQALRPDGRLVAHVVIDGPGWRTEADWRGDASLIGQAKLRYGLNCFSRTEPAVRSLVTAAGFEDVCVRSLQGTFPEPCDDICSQHLVTAVRRCTTDTRA